MKRRKLIVLFLLIATTLQSVAPLVLAQTELTSEQVTAAGENLVKELNVSGQVTQDLNNSLQKSGAVTGSQESTPSLQSKLTDIEEIVDDCDIIDITEAIGSDFDGFPCVGYTTLWLFSKITWMGGALLNLSINYGVLKLHDFANLPAITQVWGTFRDLANIIFIFILIYIAVMTILGKTSGTLKGLLANIVTAALLINFSLFFTKLAIDLSNVVALQFYNALIPSGGTWSADNGLSWLLLNNLALTTIFPATGAGAETVGNSLFIVTILGSIFLLIAAFVFIAMGIMILTRVAILLFLMVTSPIYFVGMILPQAKGTADGWLKSLTDQLVFLPVMMAFLWATITFSQNGLRDSIITTKMGFASVLEAKGGEVESGAIIVWFVFLTAMLLMSLIAAKKTGAAGSAFAEKWAGKLTFGAVGAGFRRTVGYGAKRALETEGMKNFVAKHRAVGGLAQSTLKNVSNSSFDLRKPLGNIPQVESVLGKASDASYEKTYDAQKKRAEELAKYVGKDKVAKDKETGEELGKLKEEKGSAQQKVDSADKAISFRERAVTEKRQQEEQARNSGNIAFADSVKAEIQNDERELVQMQQTKLDAVKERDGLGDKIKDIENDPNRVVARDEQLSEQRNTVLGIVFGSAGGKAAADKVLKDYEKKRETAQREWATEKGVEIIDKTVAQYDAIIEEILAPEIKPRKDQIARIQEDLKNDTQIEDATIQRATEEMNNARSRGGMEYLRIKSEQERIMQQAQQDKKRKGDEANRRIKTLQDEMTAIKGDGGRYAGARLEEYKQVMNQRTSRIEEHRNYTNKKAEAKEKRRLKDATKEAARELADEEGRGGAPPTPVAGAGGGAGAAPAAQGGNP